MKLIYSFCFLPLILLACSENNSSELSSNKFPKFSGIYPHLAYYNNENECGTGAIVPWGGRLWVITYGPHLPDGSTDKLYEITSELKQIVRNESIGGNSCKQDDPQGKQSIIYWTLCN